MLWALLSICCLGAIVNGPLFSLDASGAIGKALVYTKWKGRNVVREYVTPANPNSIAQRGRRTMMKLINLIWAGMSETDQDSWLSRASAANISTFNAMTGFNLDQQTDGFAPTKNENDTPTNPAAGMDSITSEVTPNRIVFTTESLGSESGTYVCIALTEGSTAPGADLLKIVGVSSNASDTESVIDVSGLEPGTYSATAFLVSETGGENTTVASQTGIVVTGT